MKTFSKKHPYLIASIFFIVTCVLLKSFGWSMCVYLIGLMVAYRVDSKEKHRIHMEFLRKEAKEFVDSIKKNKSLSPISASIFLTQDEYLFLSEGTRVQETRAVRGSKGGFGSVRIAKGIRIGGYSGTSESTQEWRTIDSGELYITNKKILFNGSKENRSISLDKILKVDTFSDGIKLSVDGRAKSLIFPVSNPYIWSLVINLLKSGKNPLNLDGVDLEVTII